MPKINYCKRIAKKEKVSIVVATRNNELTIERSINSLTKQHYKNIEILIIDDASDDNSLQILNSLQKNDSRITVISNTHQLGTGASRNKGLELATGEYITFQDGDDYSLPARISKQVHAFRNKDVKITLCNYVRINNKDQVIELNDRRVMKCIISMMFRRLEVLTNVGYFPDKSIGEDSDYYQMIKSKFGGNFEKVIFRTLYRAEFRIDSSFFSNTIVTKISNKRFFFEPVNDYVNS
jgi:glycosyltransferase involved in cell wall biosynthesis